MPTYTLFLECGHALRYDKPVKLTEDGERWCKKCKAYKMVKSVVEEKFRQKKVTTFF